MADSPAWQKAYDDAVRESDNSKLLEKANLAVGLMYIRLWSPPPLKSSNGKQFTRLLGAYAI